MSGQDSTRPSDRIALGSALVGGVLVAVILIVHGSSQPPAAARLFGGAATQASRAQPGHVQEAQPAGADTRVNAPTAQQPTAVRRSDSASRRQVANTEGKGVVLRASPRDDDWTPRGFMDGDWVTVQDQSGPEWVMVRGDNDQQGWVPARYLAP